SPGTPLPISEAACGDLMRQQGWAARTSRIIALGGFIARHFAAHHPNRIDHWSQLALPPLHIDEMRASLRAENTAQLHRSMILPPTSCSIGARAPHMLPGLFVEGRPAKTPALERARLCSAGLRLCNLLEHAALGLDTDEKERDRR